MRRLRGPTGGVRVQSSRAPSLLDAESCRFSFLVLYGQQRGFWQNGLQSNPPQSSRQTG